MKVLFVLDSTAKPRTSKSATQRQPNSSNSAKEQNNQHEPATQHPPVKSPDNTGNTQIMGHKTGDHKNG